MKKNNLKIKNKIINHITIKGKKIKSEKILLKSIKNLQKHLKKNTKKIIQISLILSNPIFKLYKTTKKKNKNKKDKIISMFINKPNARTSLAIKTILNNAKENNKLFFYNKLSDVIIEIYKHKENSLHIKKETQKKILINKHLFKYYRLN